MAARKKDNGREVFVLGKRVLDEQGLISLVERICLQEEEEYQKMKAGWLNTCGEGWTKEAHYVDSPRVAYHKDRVSTDNALSSSSTSSSSGKVKAKKKVSYGDICEDIDLSAKLPLPLVEAQTIYCSRTALADYNMKHGTDYKLVEPLLSDRVAEDGMGFHCNFTAAKLKKNSTPSDPKLFYANFVCRGTKARYIQCCIVDAYEGLHNVCPGCPPELAHCPCDRHRHPFIAVKVRDMENFGLDVAGSKISLAWYNKKHGTAYKLVKAFKTNSRREDGFNRRVHCNFIAELKNPCNPDDAFPKWFFADYLKSYVKSTHVTTVVDCCILDTEENLEAILCIQMGVNDHCQICGRRILHPPDYALPRLNIRDLVK